MGMSENLKKVKDILGQIGGIIVAFVIILSTIIPFILPKIHEKLGLQTLPQKFDYAIIVAVLSFAYIILFPLILYIHIHSNKKKLIDELKEITDRINANKNFVEEIKSLFIVKAAKLISNKDDFYDELDNARKRITDDTEILLMNLVKNIQEQKKGKNAKQYFEDEMNFFLERKNVKLFKIVSIHTKEKFKECWKLAKEAQENKLENYNLAYLVIDSFNEKLPKITAVQIIDKDEVILMDPIVARISNTKFRPPIFLKSKEIADLYADYYKELWKEIEGYHNQRLNNEFDDEEKNEYKGYIGYILYTGENGITLENRVWKDINSYMSQDQQFDDRELSKMGIT